MCFPNVFPQLWCPEKVLQENSETLLVVQLSKLPFLEVLWMAVGWKDPDPLDERCSG